MNTIRKQIGNIRADAAFGKRLFAVSLLTAIFALLLVVQGPESGGRYIVDDAGNVVGLMRDSDEDTEEYRLNLLVIREAGNSERSVTIKWQGTDQEKNVNRDSEINEAEREAEIAAVISNVELSDNIKTELPDSLSDGTKLVWSIAENNAGSVLLIVVSYAGLVILIAKSSIDSARDAEKKRRTEILRGLPRFTNQLLLMMNAGMILSDAFDNISRSYEAIGSEEMGFFEKLVVEKAAINRDHRTSTAVLISELASENNVKELVRISTILTENERRGSDVVESLSRESRYLWDDRKIVARESGKMIDTRMSYPLGLLLILLVVITMAPALLNM